MTCVIMAVFVEQPLALSDVQKEFKKKLGLRIFFWNNGLEYMQVLEEKTVVTFEYYLQ